MSQISSNSIMSNSHLEDRIKKLENRFSWIESQNTQLLLIRMKHWCDTKLDQVKKVVMNSEGQNDHLELYQRCLGRLKKLNPHTYEKEALKNNNITKYLRSSFRSYPGRGSATEPNLSEFMRCFMENAIDHPIIQQMEYISMPYDERELIMREVLQTSMSSCIEINNLTPEDSISQIWGEPLGGTTKPLRVKSKGEKKKTKKRKTVQQNLYSSARSHRNRLTIERLNRYQRDRNQNYPSKDDDEISIFSLAPVQSNNDNININERPDIKEVTVKTDVPNLKNREQYNEEDEEDDDKENLNLSLSSSDEEYADPHLEL